MNTQPGSELDIALVDALQLNPRADWAELSKALGSTPKTLARRWNELAEWGLAWVTASPGVGFVRYGYAAFAFINTQPQATAIVAAALVAEPGVVSVSSTSGDADLLADVFAAGFTELTELIERIETIDGVSTVTTALALQTYREGSRWRVQALDLQQTASVRPGQRATSRQSAPAPDSLDATLLDALCADGRRSWSELAQRCATSSPTARRRIERMLDSGRIVLRCEGANALLGPVIPTTFLIRAPPDSVNKVGELLSRIPQCRVVEAVTGKANILLTMWFRSTSEIVPFEASLARELPTITVTERFVCPRTFKRGGHVLDTAGRSTAVVAPTPVYGPGARTPADTGY